MNNVDFLLILHIRLRKEEEGIDLLIDIQS